MHQQKSSARVPFDQPNDFEWMRAYSDGYGYSRLCELYRAWEVRLSPTMRQAHVAGERLFVDYAGTTLEVIDGATGEVIAAQPFVAALGASNYTYAEATWTQSLADWIGSHTRAFAFFGGVPAMVVSDNLKSGITRACFYEPAVNRTYAEMAAHYTAFQRLVGHLLRQWPAKAKTPRSTNTLTGRRRADPKARGYLAVGHATGAEPKHVADLAHGQSRSRHPQLLSKGAEQMPIRRSPNGPPSPPSTAGRDPPEQVVAINRNDWSQSIGTAGRDHPVRAGRRRPPTPAGQGRPHDCQITYGKKISCSGELWADQLDEPWLELKVQMAVCEQARGAFLVIRLEQGPFVPSITNEVAMAYKDVLIYLDPSPDNDNRLDLAISIARSHRARLTGVDASSDAALEGIWRDRTTALKDLFEERTNKAGIAARFHGRDRAGNVVRYAHHADLLIASQPEFEVRELVVPAVPEAALIEVQACRC